MAEMRTPIPEQERMLHLDAARGLALLGILAVNITLMAEPLGAMMQLTPEQDAGVLNAAVFYATKIFAESKSYPLFSMLFGIGLALTYDRARKKGTGSWGPVSRRQIALLVMGLLHVVLLWYGDILAFYGGIGLIMMLFTRCKAKTLAIAAVCLVGVSVLMTGALATLGMLFQPPVQTATQVEQEQATTTSELSTPDESSTLSETATEPAQPGQSVAAASTPLGRLMQGFADGTAQTINSPVWMDNERDAMANGPFLQALGFRLINYASALVFWMLLMGGAFHIAGMFSLGMALYKAGLFKPESRSMRARLALIGLIGGIPVSVFAAFLPTWLPQQSWGSAVVVPVCILGFGPLVSLFYLCGIGWLIDQGVFKSIIRAVSRAGRLALTNYLMQSLLVSIVMAHWGLAQFGQWDRVERFMLVLGIYIFQIIFSALWLRKFQIGPAEWVLRSITYARPQRIVRSREPVTE